MNKVDRLSMIAAAQKGDSKALSTLIEISNVDIRKYAKIHCHRNDIDDVTQESLIIISQKISNLKSAYAFPYWLFTIVKRECHRALRKVYLLSKLHGVEQYDEYRDSELKILLKQGLGTLSEDSLKIVLMSDFLDYSINEIAFELNESTASIKSKLHRARIKLRDYFNK